jgi:hypothetical protein
MIKWPFNVMRVVCVLQVKVLTNPGSTVPVATPVAISTTLPPMVSALSQQGSNPAALSAPSSHHGTNTTTSLAPQARSSPAQSPAIQHFLHQLSAYFKGTLSFSSFSQSLSSAACLPACFTPSFLRPFIHHGLLLDWNGCWLCPVPSASSFFDSHISCVWDSCRVA